MAALDEVRDLAQAVTRRRSLVLWDVEHVGGPGRSILRIYVDGPDGVDLDTVAEVSEEISRALDLHDPLPGRYTLEVSTPGLERTLKAPAHFAACRGRKVVVKTKSPVVEGTHRIDGTLAEVADDHVTVATDEREVRVGYGDIKSARTVFEWS